MTQDEMVIIVNHNNRIINSCARKEMRIKGLIHRATYIFVLNDANEIYIQRRTLTKDMYPGLLDLAAGGVVQQDETYELSAKRELYEELGIGNVSLTSEGDFYFDDGRRNRVWGRMFICIYNGNLTHQKEEIEEGWFVNVQDIFAETSANITPDTFYALKLLRQRGVV